MKQKTTGADLVFMTVLYALAILILIVVLYPMWFIVIASFSDPVAVNTGKVLLLPAMFTLDGYKTLLETDYIMAGYRNTVLYTVVGTLIALAVNLPAAYALSRKDFYGRKFFNIYFIFTMFFSGGLIPTYLTIQQFHLLNTFTIMVLPFSVAVYHILVARTFFQNSLPLGLFDAARIDGCGNLRFFFIIALPLSKAVIAVIALWTAVGHWNSYFNALIYLRDQTRMPLQIILRDILIMNQNMATLIRGEASIQAQKTASLIKYASIVVSAAPIMCLYPFIQKHFNQGVLVGTFKG
ncbi:MAG: carbohydrate ABC transporter permease [Treponema sp.]|jgi:putative aldouronate transport system permease protein|nr:carbohydrate ABC transporter permease [Treponema sp.]